ncbi:MAG: arylsulfatase [Planctomycetaceae bacterium]|nr:arylsulfatase [Planctomycetaceae bacterium]
MMFALALVLTSHELIAEQAGRPNVLLIMTDDQGYGDLSINGNPHLRTPSIDGLAKSGIRFERFYVNSFCAPTRAALLTGRYPVRTGTYGVTHNKECMRSEEVTLGEAFAAAGYKTGCFGKWHNGEQFPYTPPGQGFQEYFGFHNGHINNYFDTVLIRGSHPEATKGYITDVLTDEAIQFIRRHKDEPFFCYVPFNAPHSPYQIPDSYYDKFREMSFDEAVSSFYGMCENIDENVGRFLAVLDEQGLSENTIVLFLTDNGGTAGVKVFNAGMRGGKTSVHEGGCRVPLFLRWPKRFAEPRTVTQIASHIDLLPTLLELCGIEHPDGPPLDGVSLVPLMNGQTDDWPERILFTHNPIDEHNRYPGAVRTQRYRLVREIQGRQGGSSATENDENAKPWQLYDMIDDPGQKQDLAKDQPHIVDRLAKEYENWVDDIFSRPLERLAIPVGYPEENPVLLNAPQSRITGSLHFHSGPGFAHDYLVNWSDLESTVRFDVDVVRAGVYQLDLILGCPKDQAGSQVQIQIGDERLTVEIPAVDAPVIPLPHRDQRSEGRYVNRLWGRLSAGTMSLKSGRQQLLLKANSIATDSVMDLKGVQLTCMSQE